MKTIAQRNQAQLLHAAKVETEARRCSEAEGRTARSGGTNAQARAPATCLSFAPELHAVTVLRGRDADGFPAPGCPLNHTGGNKAQQRPREDHGWHRRRTHAPEAPAPITVQVFSVAVDVVEVVRVYHSIVADAGEAIHVPVAGLSRGLDGVPGEECGRPHPTETLPNHVAFPCGALSSQLCRGLPHPPRTSPMGGAAGRPGAAPPTSRSGPTASRRRTARSPPGRPRRAAPGLRCGRRCGCRPPARPRRRRHSGRSPPGRERRPLRTGRGPEVPSRGTPTSLPAPGKCAPRSLCGARGWSQAPGARRPCARG